MYGNGYSMAIVLDHRSTATSLTGNRWPLNKMFCFLSIPSLNIKKFNFETGHYLWPREAESNDFFYGKHFAAHSPGAQKIWCPSTKSFFFSEPKKIVMNPPLHTVRWWDQKSVLELPGKPVTGSPSILKGYHTALIDGSPSIIVSPVG